MSIVTLREPDVPDIPARKSGSENEEHMHINQEIGNESGKTAVSIRSLLSKPADVVCIRDMDPQMIAEIEEAFKALLQAKKNIDDPFKGSVDPNEFSTGIRLVYNKQITPGDLLGLMEKISKEINIQRRANNTEERVQTSIIRTNGHGPISQGFFLVDKKI